MGTKHITNDGPNTIYVGGKMIAPGEGRDIDERDLPPEHRAPAVAADEVIEPNLVELVHELRAKPVPAITAELPGLTQEALDLLNELEKASAKPRTSLLAALGNELIARADAALGSDDIDLDPTAPVAHHPV